MVSPMIFPLRNRLRALAPKLALAILAPALLIGLAEGLFRLARLGLPTRFLMPTETHGEPRWANNPFYGYRFFPPESARNPPPISVPARKPPGMVRIVVLGESAAMGDPIIEFSAPRMLEKMLNHATNGPRFEVVNAAMTAINSPVIADIASELDRLQPDIVVVYMGNNEVVGPYGPGPRPRGRIANRVIPLRVALTRWQSLLALKLAMETAAARGREARHFQMDALGRLELRAGDPRLDSVYRLYEDRLERIVALARRAGARVILSTVAVNLSDSPPFGSALDSALAPDARTRWEHAYAAGVEAQRDGRTDDALAALRAAAQIDGGHAELAYRLAQVSAAAGQPGEAAAWYARARDADTRRFRADSRIHQILLESARRLPVDLVDAQAAFRAANRDEALFLDHVHFTFDGAYLLASLWFDGIAAHHPGRAKPSMDTCRDQLFFTPWGERRQHESMAVRFARPPFTARLGNAQRQETTAAAIQRCTRAIAATNLYWVRATYAREAACDPGDPFLPLQWGSILLDARRLPEALPLLADYAQRLPHHFEARILPAYVMAKANQPGPAVDLLLGNGPPYGRFLADHAQGIVEGLLADGLRREARLFGQALLERQPRFDGRRAFAARVDQL
jgi:tetratricopeptide (TPR) repeat protein